MTTHLDYIWSDKYKKCSLRPPVGCFLQENRSKQAVRAKTAVLPDCISVSANSLLFGVFTSHLIL